MCPDRQLISLYLDGELPSPWKEKLETHLSDCAQCRAVLAKYRCLGEVPEKPSAATIEAAQERVWKKLTAPALVIAETPAERADTDSIKTIYRQKLTKVWNRRITLSFPAAAAAAAAIIVVVVFFALAGVGSGRRSLPQESIAAVDIGLDDYTVVPVQDMNDVLRYLSSQDNGDFMVVRLPENSRFIRTGEPALINAADYSRTRRNPSR